MKSLLECARTLLILGRVSNLPTVWSNLLVGWIIADGPSVGPGHLPDDTSWLLISVLSGGSFLYIGGMYLNDYCDVDFDTRYCPERPIPAKKIPRRLVGLLAVAWFTAGLACFTRFGPLTTIIALLLIAAIVRYDVHHKDVAWAPVVMATCRCLLYLLPFAALRETYYFSTIDGEWWNDAVRYVCGDLWGYALGVLLVAPTALPLGLYVAGISYIARGESRPDKPTRWPYLLLLLALLAIATIDGLMVLRLHWLLVQHPSEYVIWVAPFLIPCLFLPAWMAWLLIPFWRKTRPSIGRVVSGLLAGIVLLDIGVIALQVGPYAMVTLPLFLFALLLQRFIPAT